MRPSAQARALQGIGRRALSASAIKRRPEISAASGVSVIATSGGWAITTDPSPPFGVRGLRMIGALAGVDGLMRREPLLAKAVPNRAASTIKERRFKMWFLWTQ
jgi:hypothetical protein